MAVKKKKNKNKTEKKKREAKAILQALEEQTSWGNTACSWHLERPGMPSSAACLSWTITSGKTREAKADT